MPRNTGGREPRRWHPFAFLRRQGGRLDPAAAWREYDRRGRARVSGCRYVASDHPRVLPGRHHDDCPGDDCPGCLPCPEAHCQVCGHRDVTHDGRGTDLTCATCLGDVRDDGDAITAMSAQVLAEALARGVGSRAAMLAGPVGDIEAWGYRRMSAIAGRIPDDWLADCHDERHPLWVTGTWDMLVREHLDQPSAQPATVESCWRYLAGHLTRLAHDRDFAFEELAHDLRGCRGYLEDVLHNGEQETYGAPCVQCQTPLLRLDEDGGRWWCKRCRRTIGGDQYRYAVAVAYRATARRLPVGDLAERIGVPAGTIRRWASKREWIEGTTIRTEPPLLPYVGTDGQGRKVYDVAAAQRLRDKAGAGEVA